MGKCDFYYLEYFTDNFALCCLHELMEDMASFLLILIDEIII